MCLLRSSCASRVCRRCSHIDNEVEPPGLALVIKSSKNAKTGQIQRIYITGNPQGHPATDVVALWKELEQATPAKKFGKRGPSGMFWTKYRTSSQDCQYELRKVYRQFWNLQRDNKQWPIPSGVTMFTLRASILSILMNELGLTLPEVAMLSRHRSTTTLLKHYKRKGKYACTRAVTDALKHGLQSW